MILRDISSNRFISMILIVLFMVFAAPTPTIESASESARASSYQAMEYTANKAQVRKGSASDMKRFALNVFAVAVLLSVCLKAFLQALTESHLAFHPLIARRLLRQLLFPVTRTSNCV